MNNSALVASLQPYHRIGSQFWWNTKRESEWEKVMKKVLVKLIVPAMLLGLSLLPVSVHANSYGVNARLHNQHERIAQGVHSGELTRSEQYRLYSRDRRIHGRENWDRRHDDGHLTYGEHSRLERSLNGSSRETYRLKHNNRTQ